MCSRLLHLFLLLRLRRLIDQKPTLSNLRYTSVVSAETDSLSLVSQTGPTAILKETLEVNKKDLETDVVEGRGRRVQSFLGLLPS